MMVVARSVIFALIELLITPPFALVALLTFPLPALERYLVITLWSRAIVWCAKAVCGIDHRLIGAEHVPARACVVLSKHQSAWETLAFQMIFPPQVLIIKRELLYIPFFGWGLAMLSPIAINRRGGMRAVRQMLEQGQDRLRHGFWVIVFPEGTRVAPGSRAKYQSSGAAIAVHAGVPVLPVAHNAGAVWPRNAFLKRPGLVTVSIGPLMESAGTKAELLARRAETWIENEMLRLDCA
jgi:1-acyl-sn-glycerol-3-phosphate acyltransferase